MTETLKDKHVKNIIGENGRPACVKHCQAACIQYGPLVELVKKMEKQPKMVLFSPD